MLQEKAEWLPARLLRNQWVPEPGDRAGSRWAVMNGQMAHVRGVLRERWCGEERGQGPGQLGNRLLLFHSG